MSHVLLISRGYKFIAFERDEPGMPVHVFRNHSVAKFLLDPSISISESSDFDRKDLQEIEKIIRLNGDEFIQKIIEIQKDSAEKPKNHEPEPEEIEEDMEEEPDPYPVHHPFGDAYEDENTEVKPLEPVYSAAHEDKQGKTQETPLHSSSPSASGENTAKPRLVVPRRDPFLDDPYFDDIKP